MDAQRRSDLILNTQCVCSASYPRKLGTFTQCRLNVSNIEKASGQRPVFAGVHDWHSTDIEYKMEPIEKYVFRKLGNSAIFIQN